MVFHTAKYCLTTAQTVSKDIVTTNESSKKKEYNEILGLIVKLLSLFFLSEDYKFQDLTHKAVFDNFNVMSGFDSLGQFLSHSDHPLSSESFDYSFNSSEIIKSKDRDSFLALFREKISQKDDFTLPAITTLIQVTCMFFETNKYTNFSRDFIQILFSLPKNPRAQELFQASLSKVIKILPLADLQYLSTILAENQLLHPAPLLKLKLETGSRLLMLDPSDKQDIALGILGRLFG